MKISQSELKKYLPLVIDIANRSGEILKKLHKKIDKLKISSKDAQGVVSIADKASEEFIIKELKKINVNISFLAEEASYEESLKNINYNNSFESDDYCWVIDPLDGTTNFLNGLNYFAICIALIKKGKPILGVVYNPLIDECFYAVKEEGAWVKSLKGNSRATRIFKAKNKKKLRESLFVTGFCTEKGEVFDQEFDQFKKMMSKTRGIRRFGSAALDLCYVAKGVFDGFWETGLAPWDVAASGIICQEAGVKLTDYSGVTFSPFQKSIIAIRKPLYDQFRQVF